MAAPALPGLPAPTLERLLALGERVALPPGARVPDRDGGHLWLVLEGGATLRRDPNVLRLGPGDAFGVTAGLPAPAKPATVAADGPLALLRLGPGAFERLEREDPGTALALARAHAGTLARELEASGHATILRGRSTPRAEIVRLDVGGVLREVPNGVRLVDVLPRELDGHLVVGALLGHKPVSLATPVVGDGKVVPLTVADLEGRRIYAATVGLALLEAAHALAPGLEVRLGPSRGTLQEVWVRGAQRGEPARLAAAIADGMRRLAEEDVPVRFEAWTTEEAAAWFRERGWTEAAQLLRVRRQATVGLVSCGEVYALATGPLLPSAGAIGGFELAANGDDGVLQLDLGKRDPRRPSSPPRAGSDATDMVREHDAWLSGMGVTSVGAFNELCITGQVTQLIRVAEGFHEKRIGRVADRIAAQRDRIRIIAVAGPSSSGKTTFLKRLTVQLQIDGLNPIGLSLDDYYVDRVRTPRDAKGEWDFEALEALDLPMLHRQVGALLRGEEVTLARYDFKTGTSHPAGGPTLRLRPGDVLILEGIHGLNPALLGDLPKPGELFRIFIHPATALPFDRLSRTSATDLRLLRRIVRDRHQRGYSAAENILRWPSVQAGERAHIYPYQGEADTVFDSALVYEPAVLKVFAERYLLEVPPDHPAYPTAHRLRYLVDQYVSIYPDHVPPTSLVREFIGGSGFEY
ncbi:MAG: cyclic nucleotide-binding protein [Anaeromyxobacteraceae bacterium]